MYRAIITRYANGTPMVTSAFDVESPDDAAAIAYLGQVGENYGIDGASSAELIRRGDRSTVAILNGIGFGADVRRWITRPDRPAGSIADAGIGYRRGHNPWRNDRPGRIARDLMARDAAVAAIDAALDAAIDAADAIGDAMADAIDAAIDAADAMADACRAADWDGGQGYDPIDADVWINPATCWHAAAIHGDAYCPDCGDRMI